MRKNIVTVLGNNIWSICYIKTNKLLKNYCDSLWNYLAIHNFSPFCQLLQYHTSKCLDGQPATLLSPLLIKAPEAVEDARMVAGCRH